VKRGTVEKELLGKLAVVFERLSFTTDYAARKKKIKQPRALSQKLKVQTHREVWSRDRQTQGSPQLLFLHDWLADCRTLSGSVRRRRKVFSLLQFLWFSFGVLKNQAQEKHKIEKANPSHRTQRHNANGGKKITLEGFGTSSSARQKDH